MSECVRNTIFVCGLCLILLVRLAIDWVKSEMRK